MYVKEVLGTLLATLLCTLTPVAWGLVLSMSPHAQSGNVGETITVEVRYHDEGHPTLGGAFGVSYDSDALELIDYRYSAVGDPRFDIPPAKLPGRLADLGIGLFEGVPSVATIMTLEFRVLREGLHTVMLDESDYYSPRWASAIDFGTFILPEYRMGIIATDKAPFPALDLPETIASEQVILGETASIAITIGNTGTAPLDVFGTEFVFNPDDGFVVSDDPCSGQAVMPDETCTISLRYVVDELPLNGAATARLTVHTSDLVTPAKRVTARAVVASARLRVSADRLFGANVGPPNRVYQLTVLNDGEWPALIDELRITVDIPDDIFSIVRDECAGTELAVGERCAFDIEITANEPGRAFIFLQVVHDDSRFRPSFTIWSYTTTPLFLVHADGPLDYETTVGDEQTRRITFTNKGPGVLELGPQGATIRDGFSIVDETCSNASLMPGDFCTVDLLIQSDEIGHYQQSVYFSTNSVFADYALASVRTEVRYPVVRDREFPVLSQK